mgnify:CR=1 FL=1
MQTRKYGPRSRNNARKLLDAARDLGYESRVVRTTAGGYVAPEDVVDLVEGIRHIEEGVSYPPPTVLVGVVSAPKANIDPPKGNAPRKVWEDFAAEHGIDGYGMEYAELKRVAIEAAQARKED